MPVTIFVIGEHARALPPARMRLDRNKDIRIISWERETMLKQESISKALISHYKIIKKIGEGGMAEVYEAIDLNSNAGVALKVIHQHLSSNITMRKRSSMMWRFSEPTDS